MTESSHGMQDAARLNLVQLRERHRRQTRDDRIVVKRAYSEGLLVAEIAEHTGLEPHVIIDLLLSGG